MCCASGLCGPNIDPALIEIQHIMKDLKKKYGEAIEISRIDMNTNFNLFLDNWDVFEKVNTQGLYVLPITKINGNIIAEAHYPDFETLVNKLQLLV